MIKIDAKYIIHFSLLGRTWHTAKYTSQKVNTATPVNGKYINIKLIGYDNWKI